VEELIGLRRRSHYRVDQQPKVMAFPMQEGTTHAVGAEFAVDRGFEL